MARLARRVLVIDDEPAVCELVARVLEPVAQVCMAHTGAEARRLLEGPEPFDVVFCDLLLPDTSGRQIYEQTLATRPDVAARFIFLTGAVDLVGMRSFLRASGRPFLEKPFLLRHITEAVENMAPIFPPAPVHPPAD